MVLKAIPIDSQNLWRGVTFTFSSIITAQAERENLTGERKRSSANTRVSKRLSFPPDNPTRTLSPSCNIEKSPMALPTSLRIEGVTVKFPKKFTSRWSALPMDGQAPLSDMDVRERSGQ